MAAPEATPDLKSMTGDELIALNAMRRDQMRVIRAECLAIQAELSERAAEFEVERQLTRLSDSAKAKLAQRIGTESIKSAEQVSAAKQG